MHWCWKVITVVLWRLICEYCMLERIMLSGWYFFQSTVEDCLKCLLKVPHKRCESVSNKRYTPFLNAPLVIPTNTTLIDFVWIYIVPYICSTSTSAWVEAIAMVTGMSNVYWKNWNCRGKENLYWNRDWNPFVRNVSTTV